MALQVLDNMHISRTQCVYVCFRLHHHLLQEINLSLSLSLSIIRTVICLGQTVCTEGSTAARRSTLMGKRLVCPILQQRDCHFGHISRCATRTLQCVTWPLFFLSFWVVFICEHSLKSALCRHCEVSLKYHSLNRSSGLCSALQGLCNVRL